MNWWTKLTQGRYMAEAGEDGSVEGEAPNTDTPAAEEGEFNDELAFLFKDEETEPDSESEPEKTEPEASPDESEKQEEGSDDTTPVEPENEVEPAPEKKVEEEAPEEKPDDKQPEPEKEPEEISQEERDAQRTAFLAEVEKSFAISEEDANLMITEPEKVLPRVATNIYDRAMSDVQKMFETFSAQLPSMMNQVSVSNQQASDAETQFLEANPGIDAIEATELKGLIEQFAPLVGKQNPKASNEEKLKALGRTIAAVKGINLTAPAPAPAKAVEQPVTPHSPAAPVRSGSEFGKPKPAGEQEEFISMLLNSDD